MKDLYFDFNDGKNKKMYIKIYFRNLSYDLSFDSLFDLEVSVSL